MSGLSSEIAVPRRRLKDALEDATALSYTVYADGSIGYPSGGKNELTGTEIPGGTAVGNNGMLTSDNRGLHPPNGKGLYTPEAPGLINPNPHHAKAQDIADRIAHALREAREIDERYRAALSELKAAPGLRVDEKTWADAAADTKAVGAAADHLEAGIPRDKSPADRKAWWDQLTQAEPGVASVESGVRAVRGAVCGEIDRLGGADGDVCGTGVTHAVDSGTGTEENAEPPDGTADRVVHVDAPVQR